MENIVVGDNLGKDLARELDWPYLAVENRVFPDGEVQPKLEEETSINKAVLILQKKKSENINSYIIRFCLVARKLKELAKKVYGIMPYFPYARQDKVFREGEPLSNKYIAEIVEKNLDVFLTCNIHEHRKKIGEIFNIPAYNISLFDDLGALFDEKNMDNPLVIGPDKESGKFIAEFCQSFPAERITLIKQRDVKTGDINFLFPPRNITGREIIIVDDVVSTGHTIMGVAEMARNQGVKSISFAFVHLLFEDKILERLQKFQPKRIVYSNTLENSSYSLDISLPIANFLRKKLNFK
ncbi:ribose-phosphate diphosphokinase [bacterium]|nr:ribose-phosphate diphosphokinase [bacterium]